MKKLELQNKSGRICLQFSVNRQRYSLYGLGDWNSHSDKAKAELLTRIIESDILEHCFDVTLEKYKSGLSKAVKRLESPVDMFAKWVESLEISDKNYRVHYEPVLNVLLAMQTKQFQPIYFVDAWKELSSRTYNDRIGYLRRFGKWLVDEGYLPLNPYRGLKSRPKQENRIQPFAAQEVQEILSWLYKRSTMIGAYYEFLFLTGCRPCEALGLLKEKVNIPNGIVIIDSALVRGDNYETSAKHRQRKGTKTGDVRVLPLTKPLSLCIVRALGVQQDDCLNSDLLFCNSKGEALDDTNLRDRYWKPALEACNLPYRKPYTIRHTAGSMVIENGGTLADAAKLLGHTDLRMVSTTYGHAIKGVQLPSYESES